MTKIFYRYDEAAKLLRLSVAAVHRLVDSGELERVYVLGRTPRITGDSLAFYANRHRLTCNDVAEGGK